MASQKSPHHRLDNAIRAAFVFIRDMSMSERNVYAPPTARVSDVPESHALSGDESPPFFSTSVLKLVLLSLFSFGIYELYWFYRQWKYVKEREGIDIQPFWRAFFGFFFCHAFFEKVRSYDHPALERSSLAAGPLTAGWILFTLAWRLPDPYWLLDNLAVLFLIPVQLRVNHINSVVAPGHDRNVRFTWLNWLTLILGGGLFTLALFGTFADPG